MPYILKYEHTHTHTGTEFECVCVEHKKSKTRRTRNEMKTKVPYKRGAECMAHSYVYCCVGIREKINYSTNNQNEMILFASKVK